MKCTSAMTVLFKVGLEERAMHLWATNSSAALIALLPWADSMSSADLERLKSSKAFLRRENAFTNFLPVP
jgi:hypothetical protein